MISKKIVENISNSSWIRKMFEEGEKLRGVYGADKVFDFSIGNPNFEPPKEVKEVLKEIVLKDEKGSHRYMNNAGFDDVRGVIANRIEKESGVILNSSNIVMTCGAAGGLNVVLKTILNPDEEVIAFSPYFVEYGFYVDNHGGKLVVVPTESDVFQPSVEVLSKYINEKTKAIIINSPNNPTGVIYSEETLSLIANLIEEKEKEFNSTIFIISDEPYTKIVYDNVIVPSIMKIFKTAIIVNSFSKSLALPGERIGYIAASSNIENVDLLMNGLVFCNRTLGFVNAPAIFQKVVSKAIDANVDVDQYKLRRDMLYNILVEAGFSVIKPQGAFYLFPKAPIADDVEFAKRALKYNILVVPGSGFGYPGYFRLSYCVDLSTIENSKEAFIKLFNEF